MHGKELFAAVNATLNGTSAVLLVLAFVMIKRRNIPAHAWLMIAGLTTSAVFLVSYITSYVLFKDRTSGLQPGALRTFYLVLLASHVLLAVGMLPMIVMAVWRAYRRQWERHRAIASPTYWIWLYVSVTGVIVYWMLYHLFPSLCAEQRHEVRPMKRCSNCLIAMILLTLVLAGAASACPMCKDSIPNSDATQAGSLPSGFNNSVYFVLVSFLTVLGMCIAFIVRTIRQSTPRPGFRVIER